MDNTIVRMVNSRKSPDRLATAAGLVHVYLALVVATIIALVALSVVRPAQAPQEAWIHAGIVAVFAVLLPARLRAAHRGIPGALRATGIIASVLLLANVVEALIPGLFPLWMRVESWAVVVIMAGVVLCVSLQAVRSRVGDTLSR